MHLLDALSLSLSLSLSVSLSLSLSSLCLVGHMLTHLARMLRIGGAQVMPVACQQRTESDRDRAHRRNGLWTPWVQLNQKSDQPVRAAGVAHRAVVGGVQHRAGRGGVRKPDRHLDYPGAQADEDRHQLFPAELGFLRCVHGRFQHAHQLRLRGSWRVVLRRGVLPVPQLLPGHCGVRQHLLHDGHSHRQVGTEKIPIFKNKLTVGIPVGLN